MSRRRAMWPVVATIAFVGFVLLFVFPTRALLAQRKTLDKTEHQLEVLEAENQALQARADALDTDAEIERLAREQYNLVRPGEEAYAILPAPPAPVTVPDVWPFNGLQSQLDATR